MPGGFPFFLPGVALYGCGLPSVGARHGYGPRSASGDSVVVEMGLEAPGALDSSALATHLHLDGEQAATIEGDSRLATISGVRPGTQARLDVLPLSLLQSRRIELGSGSSMFRALARGPRVCLAWTDEPSEVDFASYVVFWDEGLGGDPDTELATIADLAAREYRTAELDAGAYRFALAYRDNLGNTSSLGATVEVEVLAVPLAPENLVATYSPTTRRVSLAWDDPASQIAAVKKYLIFDNWLPGCAKLAPHANSDPDLRRAEVDPGDEAWTSNNLWQGEGFDGEMAAWRFAVRAMACDALGTALSEPAEAVLLLEEDGGTLSEIASPPPAPELYNVEPVAGGKFRADWEIPSIEDVTQFRIAVDGSEVATVATTAGVLIYSYTSSALTDGQEYEVAIRAYNGASAYSQSGSLAVTVDSSAPSGDGAMTGGLCG